MSGDAPCLVDWEKERLERSLKAEIEFFEGRLKTMIDNPTDPRAADFERRLETARHHLEEVQSQPKCSEEDAQVAEDSTPVSPLPALPRSPDQ